MAAAMIRCLLAAGLALLPGMAPAQILSCALPASIPVPLPDLPDAGQPRRVLPIGDYTLAISWSPEFCRTRGDRPQNAFQCAPGGPEFGFVLHGLWPDGIGREWPQYCNPTAILPARTIRGMMCTTPSAQLIQHEWAKHGTCMSGETPDSYFARGRGMFERLRFPDMDRLSRRPLTVGRFQAAFAKANPGMRPDMMRVTVTKTGWLDEVWLCHDTAFRRIACPATKGGAVLSQPLKVWRGHR